MSSALDIAAYAIDNGSLNYNDFDKLFLKASRSDQTTTSPISYNQADLLTPRQAGAVLKLSVKTLANKRTYGKGPRYTKIGGAVRYQYCDLIVFAKRGMRASTSETGRHNNA